MRHQKGYRKLQRETSHRNALLRNMATSLIEHGQITTTLAKAKALQPYVERIVTRGLTDSVHNRRLVARKIYKADVIRKLFNDVRPRLEGRKGGYTRILKFGQRTGDAAPMAAIQFVDYASFEGKAKRAAQEKARQDKAAKAEEAATE